MFSRKDLESKVFPPSGVSDSLEPFIRYAQADFVRSETIAACPRPHSPSRVQAGAAWAGSDRHAFGLLLLLTLHPRDGAARGATDLGNDSFLLVFRQVFDQKVIGALHFGVAVDLLQHALPDALLAVEFTHLVQNDGSFEPFAGHSLDVSPILGVVLDVAVNFGIHFRIGPKRGLISRGGIAAGAGWRRCFWFGHNDLFCCFDLRGICRVRRKEAADPPQPEKCFRDSTSQLIHLWWN